MRCIFSEIKYRRSKNIAIKRLDLVHHIQTRIGKTGKVMRQIAFRYHRHNEFLLYFEEQSKVNLATQMRGSLMGLLDVRSAMDLDDLRP